jgi:capsular polysaccharide transport system permease protein
MNVQAEQTPDAKAMDVESASTTPQTNPARAKKRHFLLVISFLICVVIPTALGFYYLYTYAKDQFGSTLAFSVRSEEFKSPLDVLGGLGQLTTSASADSDILYEYIQSQKLVENIDKSIDLRAIYSKAKNDPVFAYDPPGAIEDLVEYWGRMVEISFDSGTQLTNIITRAFTPKDAQLIAEHIQKESTELINRLNLVARTDATRYAKQELDLAVDRLKDARAKLTSFRTSTQIIDPTTNLEGQMGLLNQLEGQLAEALITGDLLQDVASSNDPRLAQAARKVTVIRDRIDAERERLAGANGQGEGTLSTLVGDYERLSIEQKFSEEAYLIALATYNTAVGEAQRQSLYLAAHIEPTLAETSQFPERGMLGILLGIFLLFGWTVIVLIFYSLRDRR